MRFGGNRYWLYLTRRALALACLTLAVSASTAAADRYAVASGGQTGGTCGQGSECTLDYAISVAGASEIVHLAAGNYAVPAPLNIANRQLIGDDPAAKPRLVGAPTLSGPTLTATNSIRDIRVESSSSYPALDLSGTGERVEAYATGADAITLQGGSTLLTSVAHTSAAGATAVRVTGG